MVRSGPNDARAREPCKVPGNYPCIFVVNHRHMATWEGLTCGRNTSEFVKMSSLRLSNRVTDRLPARGSIVPTGLRPTGAAFAALMLGKELAKVRVQQHLSRLRIRRTELLLRSPCAEDRATQDSGPWYAFKDSFENVKD